MKDKIDYKKRGWALKQLYLIFRKWDSKKDSVLEGSEIEYRLCLACGVKTKYGPMEIAKELSKKCPQTFDAILNLYKIAKGSMCVSDLCRAIHKEIVTGQINMEEPCPKE